LCIAAKLIVAKMVRLSEDLPKFHNVVDGKRIPAEDEIEVINPATGQVLCQCPAVTNKQADDAVAAAKAAFPYVLANAARAFDVGAFHKHTRCSDACFRLNSKWRKIPFEERQRIFLRAAEVIDQHVDEMARVLTLEQGTEARSNRDFGWNLCLARSIGLRVIKW
jgi:acyl-CoA reductase-like NAD-dependent aldehyde dehydrogenase